MSTALLVSHAMNLTVGRAAYTETRGFCPMDGESGTPHLLVEAVTCRHNGSRAPYSFSSPSQHFAGS